MKNVKRNAAARYRTVFETPLGAGGVVASEDGLLEVFPPFGGETCEEMAAQIAERFPSADGENALTREAASMLKQYFEGGMVDFAFPIDRAGFTPFQWNVYQAVMAIPRGEVRSYSEVAATVGSPRAPRGIGGAMAANPLPVIIPCHRVVGKGGGMTGYSAPGGIGSKRWLLDLEKRR